jgi:hypothetical protein
MTDIKIEFLENYKPKLLETSKLNDFRYKKAQAWSNKQFKLKHINFYSKSLINEFNKLFESVTSFLEGTPLKEISKTYDISQFVIKRISGEIIAGVSMNKVLKTYIGYKGKLGLDLASAKLMLYQHKTKTLPLTTDKGMGDLVNAVYKGYWKKSGITTWKDLLEYVFSKEQIVEWEELNRKELFDNAIKKLKDFFHKEQRLPKFVNKGFRDVINLIRTGLWNVYGIKSWNDMLSYVFDAVNSESKKYVGSDGLEYAINELKEENKKNSKLPKYDSHIGITCAIRRGYWNDLGIKTWNDLLIRIFGKINFTNNKYKGDEGFELALSVLKEFKKSNGRRPSNKDKGIGGIRAAILRGEWRYKGINSWKDMILNVFGEVKSRWKKYTGKEGLKNAVMELKAFREKNNKVPKVSEKGLSGIKGAVYRGEWKQFGINNWNDLLLKALGETNSTKNKYNGKNGLKKVVKILREFKEKNKKIPRTTDKEMNGIRKALYRGEWSDYGIKTWKSLTKFVFDEKP